MDPSLFARVHSTSYRMTSIAPTCRVTVRRYIGSVPPPLSLAFPLRATELHGGG